MKPIQVILASAVLLATAATAFPADVRSVSVPSGISHAAWDSLLRKYVDERGLVAYADWKENEADMAALDNYLAQFAPKPEIPAEGDDRSAALINLYNATTIRWILRNYPTDSIQALNDSFGARRHDIGGVETSLEDIEHGTLRPTMGYRAHAVLVCAARSCPPLRRFAYTPANLDGQIGVAYRAWLGREDLNRFEPDRKKAEISSIFNWFKGDFETAGGVRKVLAKFGPRKCSGFLAGGDYEIGYLEYNWGLNDQGKRGRGYGRLRMYWDRAIDTVTFWN